MTRIDIETFRPTNPNQVEWLRLGSVNARHAMAKAGIATIRHAGLDGKGVDSLMQRSANQRGFYSWIARTGYEAMRPALERMPKESALRHEMENIAAVDEEAFTGFDAVSSYNMMGLGLTVFPGLGRSKSILKRYFPVARERIDTVMNLIMSNMATLIGTKSPIVLPEDHPGWPTENPDFRNIRGNMRKAVEDAALSANLVETLMNERYGTGTMQKICHIVVFGIGANDMYLKDLPMLINADPASKRKLHSVFLLDEAELGRLKAQGVTAENTLFIAISRGGGTQETLKSMEFARKAGIMKHLVAYANTKIENKGKENETEYSTPVRQFAVQMNGICLGLDPNIGGRYMWAKGKIVLVPLALSASGRAWSQYTDAMVEFDEQFWPIGPNTTVIDLASHLYMYATEYNIPLLFMASNHPVLEAGLRIPMQLHNEAVGKIENGMIAAGPGMEMLPFAHAGADGILGAAVSALVYGGFVFDTSCDADPAESARLTAEDIIKDYGVLRGDQGRVLKGDSDHIGLTMQLLKMACVFPNQAKMTFAGAPNFMVTMNGINYRNLATLTAFWQNLMYPYLIMNGTNPESNANVAMVRTTTGKLTTGVINRGSRSPIEVIQDETPKIMK